jgi:micrococcal nuclease
MDTPPALVIVDGDTFRIGGETIRILNIDTPEHGALAKCDAERMLADVAKDRLSGILGASSGAVALDRRGRDRYGRTLALVRVRGADVGELLIAARVAVRWEGHRHNWCSPIR